MVWWQVVLIIVGAVGVGLAAGYLLNLLVGKIISSLKRTARRPASRTTASTTTDPREPSVPDLYAEIEYNRRLATKEWTGELQAFETRAWDNRGDEVHSLPPEVRTELMEAYSDMALANSITWLSTEMSRRSPSLDESYRKLRAAVASRLERVREELDSLRSSDVGSTK